MGILRWPRRDIFGSRRLVAKSRVTAESCGQRQQQRRVLRMVVMGRLRVSPGPRPTDGCLRRGALAWVTRCKLPFKSRDPVPAESETGWSLYSTHKYESQIYCTVSYANRVELTRKYCIASQQATDFIGMCGKVRSGSARQCPILTDRPRTSSRPAE